MPLLSTFGSNSIQSIRQRLPVGSALYSFTTATFSTGGVSGRTGPALSTARAGLTGAGTETWKNNTEFFNTSNGIQLWTVPQTGTYRIESWGAQGGGGGGLGARMRGDFELTGGEIIRVLVGQQGSIGHTGQYAGGGGGSFVVRSPFNTNQSILVIAGAGSGFGNYATNQGVISTDATGPNFGQNGNGGGSGSRNVGAGGFFTDGAIVSAQNLTGAGIAFVNGGFGGLAVPGNSACGWTGNGGFGGGGANGGACIPNGGPGGGYSGGGGGGNESTGGGGSFNSGTNQSNTAGARSGAGQIQITKL